VGEKQIVMGTDMPHGDRERFAARHLQERKDLSVSAKANNIGAQSRATLWALNHKCGHRNYGWPIALFPSNLDTAASAEIYIC